MVVNIRDKKIGLLMGGASQEREISFKSGEACLKALESKGYKVVPIDVNTELPLALKGAAIEVAFLALHGRPGEDGTVQGLLETMRIPYTGSGVLASALAMDKLQTKRIMMNLGIPTPDYRVLRYPEGVACAPDDPEFFHKLLVIKPAREGSTIGVTIVCEPDELIGALERAYQYDRCIIAEEYIPGTEIAAAVLDGQPLPLVAIRPKRGHYDFQSKYTAGLTQYIVPAPLDEEVTRLCQEFSLRLYNALGCWGVARVDLRVDEAGRPFLLEINTIPGMTELSLVPKAAAAAGIDFAELVERMLLSAGLKV